MRLRVPQSYVTPEGAGLSPPRPGHAPPQDWCPDKGHAHRGGATRWSDYPARTLEAVVDYPPPTSWSTATRAPEAGNGLALISATIAFTMCWGTVQDAGD